MRTVSVTGVYRAPMRSRDDGVPAGIAVERALTHGLVGFGGRLDPAPQTVGEAVARAAEQHGERLARRVARFADVEDAAFAWTRDVDGLFWLGRITGPWRYDADRAAIAADLVHVRACEWAPAPVPDAEAPAAVQASFARGGRNWQRIRDAGAAPATLRVWESLAQ